MAPSRKSFILLILKVFVTLGCLWWLGRYLDFSNLAASLGRLGPVILLIGILLHAAAFLVGGLRWWVLFRRLAGPVRFRHVLPTYYLGVFFNNVLPSAYGGDLARTARLYVAGMSGSALVGSAVLDRLLGLAAVITIGGLGLAWADFGAATPLAWLTVAGCAGLVTCMAAVLFMPGWSGALESRLGRRWPRLGAVLASFDAYRRAPRLLWLGFALSVVNQLLVVLVFLLLGPQAGIAVPPMQLVPIVMLMFLVASLPVSLGGLGPRETVLMALLLPLGQEAPDILALSIGYLIVLWASALPGLFMLFTRVGHDNREGKTSPT